MGRVFQITLRSTLEQRQFTYAAVFLVAGMAEVLARERETTARSAVRQHERLKHGLYARALTPVQRRALRRAERINPENMDEEIAHVRAREGHPPIKQTT